MVDRKSFCPVCETQCAVNLSLEGERVVGVRNGDFLPGGSLCVKGRRLPEVLNSPKRLARPLKRVGPRGSGRWQEVSWEEALAFLGETLLAMRQEHGPWTLAWDQGYGPSSPYLLRFMHLFGSPNLVSRSHVCSQPRKIAQIVTFGGMATPDVDNSGVIVVWGRNKLWTAPGASANLIRAVRRGAKLIVIDPRQTSLARMARLWLPLRPGTDGALALGLLHVLISQELYDRDFVQQQCTGFAELAEVAALFPPERTAQVTGVPEGDIVAAARMYAREKPASIEMGNGLDQHTNAFQAIRAILSLMAVNGNLNVKGGNILLPSVAMADVARTEALSSEKLARRVGSKEYPLLSRYRHVVSTPKFIQAVLEDQPERPRALVVTKGNPAVTLAQSGLVREALGKMDFIAVSDFVVTETANLADLVLPAAFACEGLELVLYDPARRDCYYASMPRGLLLNRPLPRRGDTRTDTEFIFGLAESVGLKEEFWDGSIEASLNERLRPLGLGLEDFREGDTFTLPPPAGSMDFKTPSGKVELHSAIMEGEGYAAVPVFNEPEEGPESRPDLLPAYPLIFSSHKPRYFVHSAFHWVESLCEKEPEPLVEVHPDTAARYEMRDGQEVEMRSPRGSCRVRAKVTKRVQPGMVSGVHGWGGEGNINRLTANDQCDPVLSCSPLKSSLCTLKALTV